MPRNPKFTKKTTKKQQTASRINGARSKGPTSPEGAARSSLNRLTHGMCSKVLILPGEDPREYDLLRQGFVDDWKPQGATEVTLVDQLAKSTWFLRRADRSNYSNVSTAMRDAVALLDETQEAEHARLVNLLPEDPRTAAALLRHSGPGCRTLIGRFEGLVQALDVRGWLEPSERVHALESWGKQTSELFQDDVVYDVCQQYLTLGYQHWNDQTPVVDVLGLTEPVEAGAKWEFNRRCASLEKIARTLDAAAAKQSLRDRLTREIALLKARAVDHEKRESANRADAAWRVAIDVSPFGQAMSRYEARQHREFHSALRDLVMLRKSDVRDAPAVTDTAAATDSADPPERDDSSWPDVDGEPAESLLEQVEPEASNAFAEPEMDSMSWPDLDGEPAESLLEQGEPEPSNAFEAAVSPAPVVAESAPEVAAPNEPEPAIEAASDAPKSFHTSRLWPGDNLDAPSEEEIWVAELGAWHVKGTIDLEEVERIAEQRRAANVWSDRDFENCTPEELASRRYRQATNGWDMQFMGFKDKK